MSRITLALLATGQIRYQDYVGPENIEWPISSNCESVHIISTLFKTTWISDRVIIDGMQYTGETQINQIVPTNFTVYFVSDDYHTAAGFVLNWTCTEWGEWTNLNDGTCTMVKRPLYNGTTTTGHLKYRQTYCSKL